jgi:predicted DNA-binding protein (UPF0251 family)
MARPKHKRKVISPPKFKGYKPFGFYGKDQEPVILVLEELESMRLLDHEKLNQTEAAALMEVSRPTLTRIYDSARQKIAMAFAEARTIRIEGGSVYFDKDWYHCLYCNSTFSNPPRSAPVEVCPVCGGNKLDHINVTLNHQQAEV